MVHSTLYLNSRKGFIYNFISFYILDSAFLGLTCVSVRLMNSLAHHDDRFIRGLRCSITGGSAKGRQASRRDELWWVNLLESTAVEVNFGLVSIRPLFKGSFGQLSSWTSSWGILHFGDQVSGVDVISYHGVVWLIEDSLDESSEAFLCNWCWSRLLNWCLNAAIREEVIDGRTNRLVAKIRVQDKCLVALLSGRSQIRILFLAGTSNVHCSIYLSLLEPQRSRNRSYWCRSQCWDERWRRLSSTCLKNGDIRFLSAIEIDDKSRWVRLSLGSHWWCLLCVWVYLIFKIICWPIYPP